MFSFRKKNYISENGIKKTLDTCHFLINTKYCNNTNSSINVDLSLASHETAIISFPRASNRLLYT